MLYNNADQQSKPSVLSELATNQEENSCNTNWKSLDDCYIHLDLIFLATLLEKMVQN